MPCSDLIAALEEAGELVSIAERKATKTEAGEITFESLKKVAFVLDQPKPEGKKKKKARKWFRGLQFVI